MSFAPENEVAMTNALNHIAIELSRIRKLKAIDIMNQKPEGVSSDSGLWDVVSDLISIKMYNPERPFDEVVN